MFTNEVLPRTCLLLHDKSAQEWCIPSGQQSKTRQDETMQQDALISSHSVIFMATRGLVLNKAPNPSMLHGWHACAS